MPSPEEKQEARLMFLSGRGATDIARTLGLTLRTVQRWFAEWRGGENPKPKSEFRPAPIVKTEVIPPESSPHTTEPTLLGYGGTLQDWVKDYNNLTQELKQEHRDIRIALKQKLLNELAQDGSNRAIHTLSLAVQRHGAEELRMLSQGRGDLLTISQAFSLVQSAGFTISQAKEDEQDDPVSNQALDAETTGESGQEHGTPES
ncbi:helix-turn-helix domain-containing protein [Brasilonema sp. CT11]|nr:helix-turn-helix domain-containing protein [Brasilonema sp. CT11]